MLDLLLKEFKFIYGEEEIKNVMFKDGDEHIIVQCNSGYFYRVEYNNDNITTTCLN